MSITSAMRVVISGGTGFIGTALTESLAKQGYQVTQLVRSQPKHDGQIQWDPAQKVIHDDAIENADIVINLAGASIAGGWWTENRKRLIKQSRIDSTSTLANAISNATTKPQLFISGSAVGYYGDRPGETLFETSDPGNAFMSDVCVEWERAADPAREAGVRTVHPRLGVVFSGSGGMLPLISIPFKFALGGKIGGDQHMAWIDLDDLIRVFDHIIATETLYGPLNAVAPESTTNAEFTKAMGKAMNRPAVIPVPKSVASFVGRQLIDELLLADQNVAPEILHQTGFRFERPRISDSLNAAFRKEKSR